VSVALCVRNVKFLLIRRIVLQSAACCAALPFGTLCYKRNELRRGFIQYEMCGPNSLRIFPQIVSKSENYLASYRHKSKQTVTQITRFHLRIHSYLNL
jgi:hypothetical protein